MKALNQNTCKFSLLRKGEEKYIPILQHIKEDSLWTSWYRKKSNSSTYLYLHKYNQTKESYLFQQVTGWMSAKSYSWPPSKESDIITTASLTLYNAYLSSAAITHRQLLHTQIIRRKAIWPERSLGGNMALIFWRNIVRQWHSRMAPEINMWPSDSSPKAFYPGEPTDISLKQMPAEKWAPLVSSVSGRDARFSCLNLGI